jgi:hypothetical protein
MKNGKRFFEEALPYYIIGMFSFSYWQYSSSKKILKINIYKIGTVSSFGLAVFIYKKSYFKEDKKNGQINRCIIVANDNGYNQSCNGGLCFRYSDLIRGRHNSI